MHLAVGPGEVRGGRHRAEVGRRPRASASGAQASWRSGSVDARSAPAGAVHRRATWSVQTWWPSPREPQWIMTVTMPELEPERRARPARRRSVHDLDLEEVVARAERAELVARRAACARRDTASGSAPASTPALLGPLEVVGRARARRPPPSRRRRDEHLVELARARGAAPEARPTPEGTAREERVRQRARACGRTSASREVAMRSRRTPQSMSKPMPPGLTTPPSRSMAATPPTGKP